jgi:hypothetical protein
VRRFVALHEPCESGPSTLEGLVSVFGQLRSPSRRFVVLHEASESGRGFQARTALGLFRVQQILPHEHRQDLPGKELRQRRIDADAIPARSGSLLTAANSRPS